MRLVGEGNPDAIAEALRCFDGALELRRHLPIAAVPALRYGLAACWLNRADALIRLGDLPLALEAFDEAIVLLRALPLDDDPRFARRLAIACQNRGLGLHAHGQSKEAVDALAEGIAILEHRTTATLGDRNYLLAAAYANIANVHACAATAHTDLLAREAGLRAISLVANLEEREPDAAAVGLTARHVLCHAVARRLSERQASDGAPPADVHEATDLADDGLSLVRRWEHKGVTRFRDLAVDLFRFGARVYASYQPHFLGEFLLENLDPNRSSREYVAIAEMQAIARQYQGLDDRCDAGF